MKKSAWYVILILIVLVASIAVTASSFFRDEPDKDSGTQPDDSISNFIPPVDGSAPASPGLDIILPGSTPAPTPGANGQQPQQGQQGQNNNNNNNTQPQAPVNTPAPPAPTPTPAPPAPTPTPVQTVSGSGSFSSNTGTGLNIKVDWKAYTAAGGQVMLQIDVSASSYSFYTSALWDAIWIKVNGVSYSASSPDISYDGNDLVYNHMATFHVPANTGSVPIEVVWHYNGSYSGKDLKDIEASGNAWIS